MEENEDIAMVVELLRKIKSNYDIRSYVLITNDGFKVNVSRSGNYYDILQSFVAAFKDADSLMKPICKEALEKLKNGEL